MPSMQRYVYYRIYYSVIITNRNNNKVINWASGMDDAVDEMFF